MEVKLYSTRSCFWCRKTKDFFRRNNIKYHEIDISENPEALDWMMERLGEIVTPVIEVDKEIVVGFDQERLTEIFEGENKIS